MQGKYLPTHVDHGSVCSFDPVPCAHSEGTILITNNRFHICLADFCQPFFRAWISVYLYALFCLAICRLAVCALGFFSINSFRLFFRHCLPPSGHVFINFVRSFFVRFMHTILLCHFFRSPFYGFRLRSPKRRPEGREPLPHPEPSLAPSSELRGGELGVLRVREHPLSAQVHPLTAKSTLPKLKKNFVKYLVILRSNKIWLFKAEFG